MEVFAFFASAMLGHINHEEQRPGTEFITRLY
jgi:hypothetical protein